MRKPVAVTLMLFVIGTILWAETTVKEYRLEREPSHKWNAFNQVYIQGLGDGFIVANIASRTDGKGPLFCPPRNLSLNLENYKSILDDEIEQQSKVQTADVLEQAPISVLLLSGLQRTFPCPKAK